MARRKQRDFTLDEDEDEPGTYHLKPTGSDAYTVTVRRFLRNSNPRRWGSRPYGDPQAAWITHGTRGEAIAFALQSVPRETSAGEEKRCRSSLDLPSPFC